MSDMKTLEREIEKLGSEFIATPQEIKSVWDATRNKLAKKLWDYAKELRNIKYSDINEDIFEESISDAVMSCLKVTPDSWIKEFKTALRKKIFNNKTVESKKGLVKGSTDVIKLGRNLEKWAENKGLAASITKRNSFIDEKLFEYGRSWGKSDNQIKKALDWLDKKKFIEGNASVGNDESKSENFDLLSEKSVFGFDDSAEIGKQKFELYISAANDEYEKRKENKEDSKNIAFYSKWFTNLILAALLKENLPNIDIEQILEDYAIIDKSILEDFKTKQDWRPNTNRKEIGTACEIKENNIGQYGDRFKKEVMAKYDVLLKKEGLT